MIFKDGSPMMVLSDSPDSMAHECLTEGVKSNFNPKVESKIETKDPQDEEDEPAV